MTNKINSIHWNFQKPELITQILLQENCLNKSKDEQNNILLTKLNIAFIHFLITKNTSYIFHFITQNNKNVLYNILSVESTFKEKMNEKEFLFIETIHNQNENEIVFDIKQNKQINQKRKESKEINKTNLIKIQLQTLKQLIEKETQMKILFKEIDNCFELISFVDKKERRIDLVKFLNKYEKYDKINEVINVQNDLNESKETVSIKNKQNENKTIFCEQNSLKRKINCSLIHYLLTECEGYSIIFDNTNLKEKYFIRIQKIMKNNQIIFDIEDYYKNQTKGCEYKRLFERDSNQINSLSESIMREKGIHLKFESSTNLPFQLIQFIDENKNEIDLDEFLEKHYKYDEIIELVKQQKHDYVSKMNDENEITEKTVDKYNENQNQSKWKFQNVEEIEQILHFYEAEQFLYKTQCQLIQRKLNSAMINYLLNENDEYEIESDESIEETTHFIYIITIKKNKEIIFDINWFSKQKKGTSYENFKHYWRKIQMKKLRKLLKKESGITIEFDDYISTFQIINFVDKYNEQMNLFDFIIKYNKEELIEQSNNEEEISECDYSHFTEWIYHDKQSINKILSDDNLLNEHVYSQRVILLTKLNLCMIHFLLKNCKDFQIVVENIEMNKLEFIFISKILKGNDIIFDIQNYQSELSIRVSGAQNYFKRKFQIQKLSELIEIENGMKFIFKDSMLSFELFSFVDKDENDLDLYEFVKKYDNLNEIYDLVSIENEISFPKNYLRKRFDLNDCFSDEVECI